jgi:hypothetical protein
VKAEQARGHAADGLDQGWQRHTLEQEPARPAAGRGSLVLSGFERRHHEDGRSSPFPELGERLQAVPVLQPNVEQHNVNPVGHENRRGILDRRSVSDDLEVRDGPEDPG